MGTEQQARQQTGRQMGVWAATAVVTGEAISLGIFLTLRAWRGRWVACAIGRSLVRHGGPHPGRSSLLY